MKRITLLDIIITSAFIIIISFIFISQVILSGRSSALQVQSAGEKYYYSTDQKKIIRIKGELGYTTIAIDNGNFRFIESPCKNKICVHTGSISLPNYPVICLPNKVSAYMASENDSAEFDGVTQ